VKLEKIMELLGKPHLPGSQEQLQVLSSRVQELVRLKGEAWVRDHRRDLLGQWRAALCRGVGEARQ
jgi:hypothetical protein